MVGLGAVATARWPCPRRAPSPVRGEIAVAERLDTIPVDSPDVVIAKRLLDHAKLQGFTFHRTAPDQDAPLIGKRAGSNWIDIIHIAGFSRDCLAIPQWFVPWWPPTPGQHCAAAGVRSGSVCVPGVEPASPYYALVRAGVVP